MGAGRRERRSESTNASLEIKVHQRTRTKGKDHRRIIIRNLETLARIISNGTTP
jgi:hypothetical protein